MAHHNLSHTVFHSLEYFVPLCRGFENHLYDVRMEQWHMAGIPEYKYMKKKKKSQCKDIGHTLLCE
jgi:hypothetical protein